MFEKIKDFLKKIFNKPKLLDSNKVEKEIKEVKNESFKYDLINKTEIYNLQKLYEQGKITEDDLQIHQIKKMIELYKEQVKLANIN